HELADDEEPGRPHLRVGQLPEARDEQEEDAADGVDRAGVDQQRPARAQPLRADEEAPPARPTYRSSFGCHHLAHLIPPAPGNSTASGTYDGAKRRVSLSVTAQHGAHCAPYPRPRRRRLAKPGGAVVGASFAARRLATPGYR